MLEYQWSADGEIELCEEQEITMEKVVACYHCGTQMFTGYKAIKLINEAGEEYILHESCTKKATRRK